VLVPTSRRRWPRRPMCAIRGPRSRAATRRARAPSMSARSRARGARGASQHRGLHRRHRKEPPVP